MHGAIGEHAGTATVRRDCGRLPAGAGGEVAAGGDRGAGAGAAAGKPDVVGGGRQAAKWDTLGLATESGAVTSPLVARLGCAEAAAPDDRGSADVGQQKQPMRNPVLRWAAGSRGINRSGRTKAVGRLCFGPSYRFLGPVLLSSGL